MKNNLYKSPVLFDEESHIYSYGGTKLSGITTILSKYLFPKKYENVDEGVLEKARLHGSHVHSQIESLINNKWTKSEKAEFMDIALQETKDFVQLLKDSGIKMLCSEYLVSDQMWVASKIDLVDTNYNLYDIKTTSTLDTEYLRWQLSVYAYLFELCNKDLKAGKLYGIHLRDGKTKLVEVDRISDDIIISLINAFAFNEPEFINPLNTLGDNEDYLINELADVRKKLEGLEKREKELLDEIKECMVNHCSYSIKRDTWSISRGKDSTKPKFDEAKFKEEKPAMWAKYQKMSKVSGAFRVTINDEYYNSFEED